MKKIKIKIASDYTTAPGGRFKKLGYFSGEDFRERFLEPHLSNSSEDIIIEIDLDGTEGFPSSFLDEAFGGLARLIGKERCLKSLNFISTEDMLLIDEIKNYIQNVKL